MAVLAPQDWHPPRDIAMDVPSTNSNNPSVPRQRAATTDDHPASPSISHQQQQQQQQQPYPYPVQQQQQQAGWTPSQPFYPSFYQNHQQPYPVHPAQGQMPPQGPYFDPSANAQFAQWAYQQMMFNAQQQSHHFTHMPPHPSPLPAHAGRARSASASSPGDYFTQNPMTPYNPFPSGTPPAHPGQLPSNNPNSYNNSPGPRNAGTPDQQYAGFHPYRRPANRQGSHNGQDNPDWRPAGAGPGAAGPPFQPPYARGSDANGSSTSVNSTSSSGGSRQRTTSLQGQSAPPGGQHSNNGGSSGSTRSRPGPGSTPSATNGHTRSSSNNTNAGPSSSSSSNANNASAAPRPHPAHLRNSSSGSASSSSSASASRPAPPAAASPVASSPLSRPIKSSPLSQGNFTATEKRMSRDDSDLAAMLEPMPGASMERRGGLKGRLRRALSMNASQTLREEDDEDDESIKGSSSHRKLGESLRGKSVDGGTSAADQSDTASNATVQTKKKRFVFNSRFNRSTDNISISSVSSSASVMIRKIGSLGKLARRNSLAGITSLFKDKKDKEEEEEEESAGKKGKKKKGKGKGDVSEASVSHATAELDRGSDWGGADFTGLSPAAKLARQHTLKSNAEAAAKAKAQQEAQNAGKGQNGELPTTWDKNTTNRDHFPGQAGGMTMVNEDGTRVVVEDDDSDSEDGTYDDQHGRQNYNGADAWEDGQTWGEEEEDEDVTVRIGLERTQLDDDYEHQEVEPWATNVRRSVEKTRRPAKGILKTGPFSQESYLDPPPQAISRARSNSYNSHPGPSSELGPLARMPSPDPDHIDGLQRHTSHSSHADGQPPVSFDPAARRSESAKEAPEYTSSAHERSLFSHPNSSAPALSTVFSSNGPPTLAHRSATAPASKRLAFASNLSVYDTFSASVYDRRSEPATWSRLTPALAQRIKEELNSYKMEEMEVHAASRIHTQFFV